MYCGLSHWLTVPSRGLSTVPSGFVISSGISVDSRQSYVVYSPSPVFSKNGMSPSSPMQRSPYATGC